MSEEPQPGHLLVAEFPGQHPKGWTAVDRYPTYGWVVYTGSESVPVEPFVVARPDTFRSNGTAWTVEDAASWAELEAGWDHEDKPAQAQEAKEDRDKQRLINRNRRITEIHRRNVERTPGQLGQIIALHGPRFDKRYPELIWCCGCEFSGYEAEPGVFPCKTYGIATSHLGDGAMDRALKTRWWQSR